jgi:hypothetical protein
MAGAPPGPSRWDHNPEGAIHALDDALAKAGLPGKLSPALRVLERVGQLIDAGRAERDRAHAKLEAATRALVAPDGEIDLDAYAAVLRECEPWISDDAAGSTGVGDAARQVRVRAVMTVFGMASGLHQKLRNRCRDVVAVIAGIPDPPADVSQAQTVAAASTMMIRHGRKQDWAKFVRLNDQWLAIHAAGRLLRESGQFESELHFQRRADRARPDVPELGGCGGRSFGSCRARSVCAAPTIWVGNQVCGCGRIMIPRR